MGLAGNTVAMKIRGGTFRLIAAKRGKRLGWVDDNDHPQLERFISWDKHSIWWRPATDQEILRFGLSVVIT